MWKFLLELLSYVCFVCVLCIVSYTNHNIEAYYQVKHLRELFLNYHNATYNFNNIRTINEFWDWLTESFANNIVVQNWYNGQPVNDSNGFINDKITRLIGWATMRQLRIKSDSCPIKSYIQPFIPHCYGDYSESNEESRSFLPGWTTNETTQNYSLSINQAYIYQTSEQLDTYIYLGRYFTYGGGGYVYTFHNLSSQTTDDLFQLHKLGWIDEQTRAIIIQMNLYNPSIPLFTSATMIAELLSSSGVFPSSQFDPLDFDVFNSIFQIVCVFIYFAFITYFMIVEIITLIRLKKLYFLEVWTYIELGLFACSWTAVGMHIWRLNEIARITNLFRQNNGDIYVNFQLVAYINDVFTFLLGFCCFFGTLKLLRLCRHSRHLDLLSHTLNRSRKELILFSFMFSIVFMAFLALFYLQFISLIDACSTLLKTAQMLFEMFLLKFDTGQLTAASPFLGPIYFTLFIFFVVFVCMNMFISIIFDNFRIVRAEVHNIGHDDQDVFIKLLKKLQRWFGNREEHVKTDIQVIEMNDSIKHLSNKLDRLMICINQRYGNNNVRD